MSFSERRLVHVAVNGPSVEKGFRVDFHQQELETIFSITQVHALPLFACTCV